jgi:hypothetical protein
VSVPLPSSGEINRTTPTQSGEDLNPTPVPKPVPPPKPSVPTYQPPKHIYHPPTYRMPRAGEEFSNYDNIYDGGV